MYRRLDGLPQEPPRPDRMTEALTAGDIRAVAAALYNSFERSYRRTAPCGPSGTRC